MEKEKNFVSAVVYLGEEKSCVRPFMEMLLPKLQERFNQFEFVFVEDHSRDGSEDELRAFLEEIEGPVPVTIIHMSLYQGRELAMNAGLDMAIGDFVYEFDTMQTPYPEDKIYEAYDTCLAGSDIVSVGPQKNRNLASSVFYRMFNSSSGSRYKLKTDLFRLLSRRAINRVHSISASVPYRKATYAACGLKMTTLTYPGRAGKLGETLRTSRAMDSLVLYTNMGYRISVAISLFMLLLMVAAVVYVIVNIALGVALIEGWITTMLLITGGFFGVFLLFAIVLKYLALLVDLVFKKQKYLVESVEKLK